MDKKSSSINGSVVAHAAAAVQDQIASSESVADIDGNRYQTVSIGKYNYNGFELDVGIDWIFGKGVLSGR